MKIANDIYQIAVQALVDTSAAAQSQFDASLQQLSKNKKVEVEVGVSASNNSLEKLGLQLAGVTKKDLLIHVTPDSKSVWNIVDQLQKMAREQGITLDNVKINTQNLVARLNTSIQTATAQGQGVEIPITFKVGAQAQQAAANAAAAAAKIAANPNAPWSDSFFNSANYSKILNDMAKGAATSAGAIRTHTGAVKQDSDALRDNTQAENEDTNAKNRNAQVTSGMIGNLVSYAFSIMHVIRYLREMINITIELNDAMTQLKIVTQATDEEYSQYAREISKTATQIGIATKDLIDASTVYARLGYTLEDSGALAKYTGMLQNVGDIDASTAQSAITSIVKAFDIDISDIESVMDRLVVVGNNFPISVSQIAEGMMNASSSLHAAGNDLNESIALLTAANTTTQNISKASTAVRTISARLRNTKAELDELGEVVTEAKYQELVDMITGKGVSLVDSQGELRSTYDVLKDLAAVWKDIGINERAALATQIAGVRQQNVFYSILEQFQEAEKAMDAMSGSAGALDKAYDIYMESITAHINQFKAAFQAFSQTIMDSGLITRVIELGTGFVKFADSLARAAKELHVFTPLLSTVAIQAMVAVITKLTSSLKTLFTVGSAFNQWMVVLQALALVITGIKVAYDALNVTLDEHLTRIQNTQEEITNIEDELTRIRDRMEEIQAIGPLSITEAGELSKLKGEYAMLEARLVAEQKKLEAQQRQAREKAQKDASSALAHNTYQSGQNEGDIDRAIREYKEVMLPDIPQEYRDLFTEMDPARAAEAEAAWRAAAIAVSKAQGDVEAVTDGLISEMESTQQIIDALDPERDADLIEQLKIRLVEMYDVLGAEKSKALAIGDLFDDDTASKIDDIVKKAEDGQAVFLDIVDLFNELDSEEGGLFDKLEAEGIDVTTDDLLRYILALIKFPDAANKAADANDDFTDSLTKTIDKMKRVSPGMKQLNEIYADIANGKKFDFNRLLNNEDFTEAFGNLGEEYTQFLQTVASAPDDIEKCQEAFDKLTAKYVKQAGVLDDVTSETRDMTVAMLEMMGVANAADIIDNVILAEEDLNRVTDDVTNNVISEIQAQDDLRVALGMTGEEFVALANSKGAINATTINTAADIQNIIDLANASYAGADALAALEQAKNRLAMAADFQAQGNYAMAKVAADTAAAWLEKAKREWNTSSTTFKFTGGNASSTGSGSGGSSSSKTTKEYIADTERFYDALKRLESAKLAMAEANRKLESSEDLNEKIRATKEMLDLYNAQADAINDLIEVRKQSIETEAAGLRALGFEIEYNNKTNELYVANLEHINDLTADSVGEYDSLEEATNELRKETEKLLDKLDEWNEANQESVDELHDLAQSAKEARKSITDFYDEIVDKANEVVDGFQNVYKVLTDAAKEYAQTGYLSVDSLQAILDLGPKYLAMLMDENGQLVINEQNLQAVIAAKTQDMAAETALSYAKQVLLATERGEEDVLRNLTDATAASSAATWDLAFATVGLAKAIGTANGMSEEYYDNAVSYLTSMQSLTETAVNSIPQYYETLKSSYISQQDALNQILKLTEDMLKWENQQAIDALEKQKDAYADIIDQKKELIKLTKEEQDHEKDLAEKIAEIAKLQARIDQLSLDDSREAQAQKRKLEEELAKLQKSLTDSQAEYSLDVQNDALDAQLEAYNNEKDDEIAALEDSLNSAEKLYQAALHELETDYGGTIERLKNWNYEVGNTLQQSLLDAIDAATAALDRFGGSFSAALEGVEGYTNLGTNNTSGAATSASANNIISSMRSNSLAWWTASSAQQTALSSNQAQLAQQYRNLSGDNIYSENGKWYHANGEQLYSLSNTEIAKAIVNKMKQNSADWFNTDDAGKSKLNTDQIELARRLSILLGTDVTRDANGTWWINGKKLYDVYHSGGIVGGGSFKQNEVMALLEKGEAVLDEQKQKAVYRAVDFISMLSDRIGNSLQSSDLSRLFGGVSPASVGAGYASLIGGGLSGAGGLIGNCNIERIDVVAPIQVVQKLDREEIQAHAEMIGAVSAQYIKDGFTKRGIQVGASWY